MSSADGGNDNALVVQAGYGLAHIGGVGLGLSAARVTGQVLPFDSTSNLCGIGSLKVGLTTAQW